MTFKKIILLILIVLVLIQFIRPVKNISISSDLSSTNILRLYGVPDSVQKILKTSCYDCHSNNTVYPWYSKIQPVAWWLNNHIEEGKEHLNFDEFGNYKIGAQYKKLEEVMKTVKDNYMPLNSYVWIHKYAILNNNQKGAIAGWATVLRDSIKSKYPADSLITKKSIPE